MGGSDAQLRQPSRISGLYGLLPGEQASRVQHGPPCQPLVHCWPAHKNMPLLSPAEYAAFHQTDRGRADRCVSCNLLQYAHDRFAEVGEQSMAQCFNCTSTTSKADQQDVCRDSCRCRAVCVSREGCNMQHVSQVLLWCCYCSICINPHLQCPQGAEVMMMLSCV